MRKSNKGPFLLATKRMMRGMDHILTSTGVQWQCGPFDIRPYITAMLRLCEELRVEDHPIDHLRQVACVMESLRDAAESAELKLGEENAVQYERWLAATFPKAFAQMQEEAAERVRKHALN
jgi:hypothetical protein